MKLLSIVVPVYNVEKYVEHCIASILSQSFNDFELILVDDGSTDSSGKICDDFALRDDRVKVFHKENGGLMSAWKYGVERSNGKYIGFVDSDDWIDLDMYEVLIGKAESTNADLVCSAFITETNDGERSEEQVYLSEGFYNRQSIQEKIYPIMITSKTLRKRVISSNRVTKLFKREILNKVLEDCDERISIGEDFVTTFAYMQNVDSVYVLDKFKPYHYRIHSSSMIRKHNNDKYEKILMLRDVLLNINNKYKRYDFSKQIHTDYLDLYLRQLECEILSSKSYSHIKQSMKEEYFSNSVQDSLRIAKKEMLNNKNRLYLLLLHLGMFRILYLIRKLK